MTNRQLRVLRDAYQEVFSDCERAIGQCREAEIEGGRDCTARCNETSFNKPSTNCRAVSNDSLSGLVRKMGGIKRRASLS